MKLKILNKELIFSLTIGVLFLLLPWGFSHKYGQPGNGYLFTFIFFIIILIIFYCLINLRQVICLPKISIIDLLLFFYISFALISSILTSTKFSFSFVLELIGYTLVYVVIRTININPVILLVFLLLSGLAQAVYGNLQLYGFYPSHHSLFKMTGSFFNPGPYAGYLVSILPVAIALSLFKYQIFLINSEKHIEIIEKNTPKHSVSPHWQDSFRKLTKLSFKINQKFFYEKWITLNPLLFQYLTTITIIVILLVLPASKSRAAWVAAIASFLFISGNGWYFGSSIGKINPIFLNWRTKFGLKHKSTFVKITAVAIVLSIFSGGLFALYNMKKDSANGRIFIWKVTAQMIKQKPLFGHGLNKFDAHYMDYQADYFKKKPTSNESFVADNTKYAFNEFLRITSETGIIGLTVCLAILYFVLFGNPIQLSKKEKLLLISFRAAIVAIIVFGFFSYPAKILPIKLNFILFLALSTNYLVPLRNIKFNNVRIIKVGLNKLKRRKNGKTGFARIILTFWFLSVLYYVSVNGYKLYHANLKWKIAFTTYQMGAYRASIKDYTNAYPLLRFNGDFLLSYGKALSMADEHKKAITILEYAKNYYPNTILYTALGDSYKELGKIDKAETSYLQAWYMIPSRFYPKYLLAKLYYDTGQNDKAMEVAEELLKKEVKIQSTAIMEIKEEMKNIIEPIE